MRKALSYVNLVFTTLFLCFIALCAAPFDRRGEAIHKIARLWAKIYCAIAGIKVTVEGAEHLSEPPYIFMANHQSALDIHALLSALPFSFKFVAKRELFQIPVFGWAIKRAGYVSLDRDNPRKALKAMDEAAQKIRAGANILIFPEGTRNVDGNLLPFKKGGFSLVFKARVPLVPLGICGTAQLQPEGSSVPERGGHVVIRVGEPMTIEGTGVARKNEVMEGVRAAIERLRTCQTK